MSHSYSYPIYDRSGVDDDSSLRMPNPATTKASVFDRLGPTGATGSSPPAASVFDRLGNARPSKASAGVDGEKWGHDGFEALYGKVASRRQTGKAAGRPAPYGGGMRSDRMATSKKPPTKVDLRSKLQSGGKPTVKRGKDLPEKCPW